MKRSGFTMIELIFVIVILGILAAVALPKFIGVAEQAQVGKIKGYVGSLNRTVAPALWSESISAGTSGLIVGDGGDGRYTADIASTLPPLEDILDNGSDMPAIVVTACGSGFTIGSVGTAAPGSGQTAATGVIGGKTYTIGCLDGTATSAPQFWLEENSLIISK